MDETAASAPPLALETSECQTVARLGGKCAHVPVRLHGLRTPARGGAVLLGRRIDLVPGVRGSATQGVLGRGDRLQGLGLLSDRLPVGLGDRRQRQGAGGRLRDRRQLVHIVGVLVIVGVLIIVGALVIVRFLVRCGVDLLDVRSDEHGVGWRKGKQREGEEHQVERRCLLTWRARRSVPVRRALGQQPFVVAAGTLSPARIGVIASGLRQHGRIIDPLLLLGKINHPVPIVHAPKSRSALGERQQPARS